MNTTTPTHFAEDYSRVLEVIFEITLRSGIPAKDILPACSHALERAISRYRSPQDPEPGGLIAAGLVLDAWHRDRRYLTRDGTARAVRLVGRAPSVQALVRACMTRGPSGDVVARRLKDLHLIVHCGKGLYRPASDIAILSAWNPLVLQHTAQALSTLLETVGRNVNSGRALAPLIERVAEVPDLPRKHIAEFQRFTRAQGRIFLRTINDWLETRRAKRLRGLRGTGVVRAGIHTYAYVAPRKHAYHVGLRHP